jgi:hypothetical protein
MILIIKLGFKIVPKWQEKSTKNEWDKWWILFKDIKMHLQTPCLLGSMKKDFHLIKNQSGYSPLRFGRNGATIRIRDTDGSSLIQIL